MGRGRFLQAIGGTENTRPDLLGDGKLAYQQRFAPGADFVAGQWNELVTERGQLGAPEITLYYPRLRMANRLIDLPLPPTVQDPDGTEWATQSRGEETGANLTAPVSHTDRPTEIL